MSESNSAYAGGEVAIEEVRVGIRKYGGGTHNEGEVVTAGDGTQRVTSGNVSVGIVGAMAAGHGLTDEWQRKDESDCERFKKLDEKYVSDPSLYYDNDRTDRKRDESEEDNLLGKPPGNRMSNKSTN